MAKYEARGNVSPGKVQRAFYLSRELADILRIEAAKRNESQSAIVERALKKELAQELAQHGRHMAQKINEYRVIYSDHQGTPHEAVQLPWSVVRSILGREHRGTAEDDAVLIERLLESGAPEWVRDAEGWVDEHGWGLIGPEIVDAEE